MPAPPKTVSSPALTVLRHDLRTPLNHIVGYTEMALEDARAIGNEKLAEPLDEIRSIACRIAESIQSKLSPAHAQIQQSEVDEFRQALAKPINEIIKHARGLLQQKPQGLEPDIIKIGQAAISMLSLTATPALEESLPPETTSRTVPTKPYEPLSGHVLVVDDNEENRDVLHRLLVRYGLTATTVASGQLALEAMVGERFDLILLDVLMPELDGLEVLRRLKANPGFASTPVIMVSAVDALESVVHCIETGAEDYLLKPFQPVLLRVRVAAVLERKRLRERLLQQVGDHQRESR